MDFLFEGLWVVWMDKCGYGCFICFEGFYFMGVLIIDVEVVCDYLNVCDVVFVGLLIGGMIV